MQTPEIIYEINTSNTFNPLQSSTKKRNLFDLSEEDTNDSDSSANGERKTKEAARSNKNMTIKTYKTRRTQSHVQKSK